MQVEFVRIEEKGRRRCSWEAVRAKRVHVPGTIMGVGNGLPHDLAQYVIEAATGTDNGFWGCVAKGATFRSTSRRRTRPGRAVIAEHRRELDAAEELAGRHLSAWGSGKQTPVTEALDTAMAQWRQLRADERLVFIWPQCRGEIRPLDDR